MKLPILIALFCGGAVSCFAAKPISSHLQQARSAAPASDSDQTIRAMHDEMQRSKDRLSLPGAEKPFFIQYRLLDVDVRAISASFGAEVSSATSRSRFMSVDVRVGDYHLDSSNFFSEDGFEGFLGSTGEVGIDRDYNSLRQDLWLATDQAYKSAVTQMSLKQAFLRSLTKPPEIDDFSQTQPVVRVDPRIEPDWTSRNWEDEARKASVGLKSFPDFYGSRVSYYLIYATTYVMTSEGTTLRTSRSVAAIEAAMDTQADDGMPLHNFYSVDVPRPADLPDPATVAQGIQRTASDLMALRAAPLVSDFTGPILFDPQAAGSLIAQLAAPSLSGARPPLSSSSEYDTMMERVGGRSEWSGRMGTRVLPENVTLFDDPTAKDFAGQNLMGAFDIDDEGTKAQRVDLVVNGILKNLLMSRRPGPEFDLSNGHARSALLSEPQPLPSNLFLQSTGTLDAAALQKKFLDACKDDGHQWCLEIERMDNPALASVSGGDFSEIVSELAGGIASGARLPLMIYRVYVADGHKELVRGGMLDGLNLRSLRNILGIGSDTAVYTYMQNPAGGLAATALGAFGSAQGGIPSTVTTPSLLLEEAEVRGFHGEPRRVPLISAPPLN